MTGAANLDRREDPPRHSAKLFEVLSTSLASLPLPVRWAVVGAVAAGILGGVVGFLVGLSVHWQTAWFAVVELGLPSAVAGAFVGLLCGGAATAVRRH